MNRRGSLKRKRLRRLTREQRERRKHNMNHPELQEAIKRTRYERFLKRMGW